MDAVTKASKQMTNRITKALTEIAWWIATSAIAYIIITIAATVYPKMVSTTENEATYIPKRKRETGLLLLISAWATEKWERFKNA